MSYLPREDADDDAAAPRHMREQGPWGRVRGALGLTLLSTVLPGLGLAFTCRRALGIAVFVAFVIVAIGAGWYVHAHGLLDTVSSSVSGNKLLVLMWVLVIGALIWIGAIIWTAVASRPRPGTRGSAVTVGVFALVMCLLVGVPAAWATSYVGITRNTVSTVFVAGYVRTPGSDPSVARNPTPSTPATGSNPWKGIPRVNVLLIGSDAGSDRTGVRTDSMIVASINTKTGDTVLISIPRNLQGVPFPKDNPLHAVYPNGYRCANQQCLMNAIWTDANTTHRSLFPKNEPNPGMDSTREVIEQIVGLKISDTVVINLRGFEQLVNAMGGVYVNVNVPKPGLAIGGSESASGSGYVVTPGSIKGYIKPGYQKLDGYQALWYSRSRVQSDDYHRMARQRCMINDLVNQVNPAKLFAHFAQIMDAAKANVTVDIPESQLPAFVTLIERAKKGTIRSVAIEPPTINTVTPNFALIRTLVSEAIAAKHVAKKKTTHPAKKKTTASPTSTAKPVSNLAGGC